MTPPRDSVIESGVGKPRAGGPAPWLSWAAAICSLLGATASGGCQTGSLTTPSPFTSAAFAPLPDDPHSFANTDEARVSHVHLDLFTDFERHVLRGEATLSITAVSDAREIILDTDDLHLEAVRSGAGRPLEFSVGKPTSLGRPLRISLPDDDQEIIISYETSPDASALQWLEPEQTAGGDHPFRFSQGQATRTRSWIPTQDSPGVRQTYSADVSVPRPLTALMSAERDTSGSRRIRQDGTEPNERPDYTRYRFRMDRPIPPYLIALAVGDVAFAPISHRAGVWAEPSVLARAAWEFADMEGMLRAAERLFGPYRWER